MKKRRWLLAALLAGIGAYATSRAIEAADALAEGPPEKKAPAGEPMSMQRAYPMVATLGRALASAPGLLNLPSGVAVDPNSGDVYIADTVFQKIQRFTADGRHIKTWDTRSALGVTVDPNDGSVLLTLPGQRKVIRYTKEGEQIGEITGGEMPQPIDATVAAGDGVVAVLSELGEVDLFTRTGEHIRSWFAGVVERPAGKDTSLYRHFGISFAPDGRSLYVANSGVAKISQYDRKGNLIRRWGEKVSSDPGKLRWPRGVEVGPRGEVYVADTDNERIQAFTAEGKFLRWFRGPHDLEHGVFHPRAVAVNPRSGDVYAAAAYAHRVDRFDNDGNFIQSIGAPHDDPFAFNEPRGIAVDPRTGRIFVADRREHRIRRFSTDRKFEKEFPISLGDLSAYDPRWVAMSYYKYPSPIEIAPDGTLWMIPQAFKYPDDPTPEYMLRQYSQDGEFLKGYNHPLLAGYMTGFDINDRNGEFWISSPRTKGLLRFSAAGALIKSYQFESPILGPAGVVIDEARGRVIALDHRQEQVRIFNLDGEPLFTFGGPGKEVGSFNLNDPNGVEVDECGRIYVPDHGNRRVQVFSSAGKLLDVIRTGPSPAPRPRDVQVVGRDVFVLTEEGVRIFQGPEGCD